MLPKLILVFLFCSGLIEAQEICEPRSAADIKTYTIDLEKEPRDRFKDVIGDFKEPILKWVKAEKDLIDAKILPLVLPLVEEIAAKVDDLLPYPFNEEIKGIAEGLGISVGDVVLVNIIYDMTAFCTGILAVDAKGQVLHGRNLDYDLAPYLSNLTFIAKFHRNDELVFTSAHLAGFIGVITGHKYKQFTFQINERDQGEWWVNALYLILDRKATPLSFLTRHLMENMTSYAEAVNLMSKSDLIAPAYFIIGGVAPSQATVLTRNQTSLIDAWTLNPSSARFDSWFLIETNYDHWTQPPANDDRRDPGIKYMQGKTQKNMDYEALADVMSTQPVCNKGTAYSVVMSAMDDSETGFKMNVY